MYQVNCIYQNLPLCTVEYRVEYPVDWKTSYCLLGMASLLLLATGMTCRREKTHARSECRAAVCMWCLLSPHLSADKESDKQSKFLPAMTGPFLYWLGKSFGSDSSPTPNVYGKLIPAASNSDTIYGTLSPALSYVPNALLSGKAVSGAVFLIVGIMFLMHTTHK